MPTFSQQIRQWAELQKLNVEKVISSVAIDLSTSVILLTPVDKGFARNNWIASIDTPSKSTVNVPDKSGQQAIKYMEAVALKKASGNVFILINNLPYIYPLEFGTYGRGPYSTEKTKGTGFSVQAPGGMVRISVRRFRTALRKAIANVK